MKTVDPHVLMDWWLGRFFNTSCKEVIEKFPQEAKEGTWFKMFKVTQDQHDEWSRWAKAYIKKETRYHKAMLERSWPYIDLQCGPSIIQS